MSLPFADNPDKSSIYNDLKVKKLVDLNATDFDSFRARMDAQGVDGLEDEYRRLLLLGLASNQLSLSGPIPSQQIVLNYTFTDEQFQDSIYNGLVFRPNEGEVWQYQGGSVGQNTGTDNVYFRLGLTPTDHIFGTTSVVNLIAKGVILISSNSASDYFPLVETDTNSEPTFVTKSNPFFMYTTSLSSGSVTVNFGFIRVR